MSSASALSDAPRLNSSRSELRKTVRKRLHYAAWIRFAGETVACDCAVADISENGTKLIVSNQHEIPDEFELVLSARFGLIRRCRVVSRDDGFIGVRFLKGFPPITGAATPEAEAPVNLDC